MPFRPTWKLSRASLLAHALVLALTLALSGAASAHRPLFPGPRAAAPDSTITIANPAVSHVLYIELPPEKPPAWGRLEHDRARPGARRRGLGPPAPLSGAPGRRSRLNHHHRQPGCLPRDLHRADPRNTPRLGPPGERPAPAGRRPAGGAGGTTAETCGAGAGPLRPRASGPARGAGRGAASGNGRRGPHRHPHRAS